MPPGGEDEIEIENQPPPVLEAGRDWRGPGGRRFAGVSGPHWPRAGRNDRIRLGVIGCGGMGTRHLEALAVNPHCEVAAVCDCFTPRYENAIAVVKKFSGKAPDGYQDFRRVLDRPDIDAIFAPTPDHWHPLMVILGCQAGKDVYVEKPASPTVAEGRAMVQAARRYGRIVQLGTQQRSMTIFQEAIKLIHSGRLGQITSATCWIGVNGQRVGMSSAPIPEGLDWDMWLGPSPWEPYSPDRQYGFMGCHDYARGGELTNWGVHLMDIVHWGIRQDRPLSVQALGGSYRGSAGSENYENVDVLWEYPGCTVTWEQRHQNEYRGHSYGIKFQGTEGQLLVDRNTFDVLPAKPGDSQVHRRARTKLGPSAPPQQLLREHEDTKAPRGRDRARPPIDHAALARGHRAEDHGASCTGMARPRRFSTTRPPIAT